MFDLYEEKFDLGNVYPTNDLVESLQENYLQSTNNSDDNFFSNILSLKNANLTLEQKIALEIYERNGPVRDELSTASLLTIVYGFILLTGVIGNLATCIVIVKNKYMHTTVNFYLFSLACSDLLLLVLGLPQEMYMLWQRYPYIFGEHFCVLRAFTSETSTNASILTITAFTIERYLAICHPLKVHTMSQLSRATKAILIIWAISAICSILPAAQLGIVLQTLKTTGEQLPQTAQCVIKNPLKNSFEISAFCFFILPMAVISVLYVLIGLALRHSSSINNASKSSHHHNSSPTHICNQNFSNNKTNQRSNNISNPTTVGCNDVKSVKFCTNVNKSLNDLKNSNNSNEKNKPIYLNESNSKNKANLKTNFLLNDKEFNSSNSIKKSNSFQQQSPYITESNEINVKIKSNELKPSDNSKDFNLKNNSSSTSQLLIKNENSIIAHRSENSIPSAIVINKDLKNNSNIKLTTVNTAINPTFNTTIENSVNTVNSSGNSIHHHRPQQITSRRSVIKMLVAIVVSFFICWSPFHAQRIMASHITRDSPQFIILIYRIITYVSAITYYLTATINPILYQLMSLKFRLAFKETFGFWAPFLRPTSYCNNKSCIGLNQTNTQASIAAINYNQTLKNKNNYDQISSSIAVAHNTTNTMVASNLTLESISNIKEDNQQDLIYLNNNNDLSSIKNLKNQNEILENTKSLKEII